MSNLEASVTEADVINLIQNVERVEGFKWLREESDKAKMCIVKLPSVRDSVEVIAK